MITEAALAILLFKTSVGYSGPEIPKEDIACMAHAIYHEARGEPPMGQIAVGWVIKNRVGHKWYRDTICDVVYQPSQFTDLYRGNAIENAEQFKYALNVAIITYLEYVDDPTQGSIMYHNPKKAPNPSWDFDKLTLSGDIYNHRFYSEA